MRVEGGDLDELRREWGEKPAVGPPPAIRQAVADAPAALSLRVRVPDPRDLDYVRDTVGVLQVLADGGGVAIQGLQTFGWWTPADWRNRVFEKGQAALVAELTVIMHSPEEKGRGLWVHTRGMRQFGRPDLSVRHVPEAHLEAAARLCNALNKVQVDGGLVDEGQEIRSSGLPAGMSCHHAGDVEDPDFNNAHIEIKWPD